MNTKLTLVMDSAVISSAKTYAHARETSVSKLVENLLKLLAAGDRPASAALQQPGPLTASLTGAIPLRAEDKGKTAKELIREAKQERLLRDGSSSTAT